jgi:hypothetical protein
MELRDLCSGSCLPLDRAGYGPVIVTALAANSTVFAVRVIA